jgi:hypothetical protein
MINAMEISIRELVALGVKLGLIVEGQKDGPEIMVSLVEDNNWTYTETERRLEAQLPRHATITATPQGHFFANRDVGPLLMVLRKGEADAELQAWIADMIERRAFAQRKSLADRIEAMGALGEALEDLDFVEELLRERGPRCGSHKQAVRILALRYGVHVNKLEKYLKRGGNDRHRVMKRVSAPFKLPL